ncbi:MAG: hypothetical protein Q8N96_12895 [Methylovulum sp.]|nr:hypothetical protein [Methylovulum sp.]
MSNYSQDCIEIINYLVASGSTPDAFLKAFPAIHHFYKTGGDASLKSFYSHCQEHDIEGETNLNVWRRLNYIKEKVEVFITEEPNNKGVSYIRFLGFAKDAVEDTPFKR